MSEKMKKKVRPTWATVKELEDTVSLLLKENYAWRRKYRELVKRKDLPDKGFVKGEDYDRLYQKKDTLEQSNKLMEYEMQRIKAKNENLEKTNVELKRDIDYLENRSWWRRLFNY